MASHLVSIGWEPDFIISSDARRTRETLHGLSKGFTTRITYEFLPSLYCGGYLELLKAALSIPSSAETVLALGHNPGWEEVVQTLTSMDVRMKTATCALTVLPRKCTWAEALQHCGSWRLAGVVYPREFD